MPTNEMAQKMMLDFLAQFDKENQARLTLFFKNEFHLTNDEADAMYQVHRSEAIEEARACGELKLPRDT